MKSILYMVMLLGAALSGKAQTANQTKATILNITNFHVYAKDAKLIVDWSTDGTKATNYWEVQRSTEGVQFTTIALVLGADPGQAGDQYKYMEKLKDEKNATVYYRVRHVSEDGTVQLSNIIQGTK